MRYFNFITKPNSVFYKLPEFFNINSDKDFLSHSLGATLYMGGNRRTLLKDLMSAKGCSVALCLEDSVPLSELKQAEKNVLNFFKELESLKNLDKTLLDNLPLIFVRVRNLHQLVMLLEGSSLVGLCGFIIPKFRAVEGVDYLSMIAEYNKHADRRLYTLPILETPEIIHKTSRINELSGIKDLLDSYKELVLNIRIGGTDFSGLYSLRRGKDFTIYDLAVIRDCISDIINIFQGDGYIISAPVNEYFNLKPPLHQSGFVREILLDKQNGLVGKTVIHPGQVDIVNSLMAVTKEDYLDAESIINSAADGVIRSTYRNKMNEVKPHLKWAYKTILLSKIMGVLNDDKNYKDILRLSEQSVYRKEPESIVKYI